jgi:hypothetical protein
MREQTVCPSSSYQATQDLLVRSAPSRLQLPDSTFPPLTSFPMILSRVVSNLWTSSLVCPHCEVGAFTELKLI